MNRLSLLFYLLLPIAALAQKKIASTAVNDNVASASVDRVGELYVSTNSGQILKLNINGELLAVYKNGIQPSLFEPRDGSRLFAFFRKDRRIDYLNPSFEVSHSYLIDSAFVIEPWLACSSGDYNVWVLDAADQSFKKINPRTSTIEVESSFPKELAPDFTKITLIREYQGFLFFLDIEKGIHIFNGFGKWIKTFPVQHLTYFNFIGEELYFPKQDGLVFYNLFSGEQREMPISKPFLMALVTDERLFVIQSKSVDFFEFKP
jgi:hypothetical protein